MQKACSHKGSADTRFIEYRVNGMRPVASSKSNTRGDEARQQAGNGKYRHRHEATVLGTALHFLLDALQTFQGAAGPADIHRRGHGALPWIESNQPCSLAAHQGVAEVAH